MDSPISLGKEREKDPFVCFCMENTLCATNGGRTVYTTQTVVWWGLWGTLKPPYHDYAKLCNLPVVSCREIYIDHYLSDAPRWVTVSGNKTWVLWILEHEPLLPELKEPALLANIVAGSSTSLCGPDTSKGDKTSHWVGMGYN